MKYYYTKKEKMQKKNYCKIVKAFYKFMNNALYGKENENMKNKVSIILVNNQ